MIILIKLTYSFDLGIITVKIQKLVIDFMHGKSTLYQSFTLAKSIF